MKNLKTTAFLFSLSLCIVTSSFGQKKTVILYNSQPVKVELSKKGSIETFIEVVPDYMAGYDLNTEVIEVVPTTVENPVLPEMSTNARYAIVSTEREELIYKEDFATLTRDVIGKLNAISAKMKADPNVKVLLTAHTTSYQNQKLTDNRLASATTYLRLKGIQKARIKTEIQQSESLANVIAVNYLN